MGGDFLRGFADGPRKTLDLTLNGRKAKRRTNKNETTDCKTTPDATKTTENQRRTQKTKQPQKNNPRREKN